jgi:hypothetical protein
VEPAEGRFSLSDLDGLVGLRRRPDLGQDRGRPGAVALVEVEFRHTDPPRQHKPRGTIPVGQLFFQLSDSAVPGPPKLSRMSSREDGSLIRARNCTRKARKPPPSSSIISR